MITIKHSYWFSQYFVVLVLCQVIFISCQTKHELQSTFSIADGYDIQLIASEPAIKDPVDIEFDQWGRAYVLEMPGYPFEDQESRIVLLRDNDADEVYEDHTVYAEQLELASSILPYRNGLLVAAPPYLLFIKDIDGDLIADERDTLLSGFATGNLQHNYNGLSYGLDGWIYAANGGNNGDPYWFGDSLSVVKLNGRDFRFNLDTKEIEVIGQSSGGFELAFDEYGKMYTTHNTQHIAQLVFPTRYTHNLNLQQHHQLENISDHDDDDDDDDLARIYPIGEQETRVNHPEQAGYFSGACGVTYYGGASLGNTMDNTVWIADVVLNLIHIDKIVDNGSLSKASRIVENSDFLSSRDRSFRPVNLTVGPDGAMYIVDMQREVIKHPEWIPDEIEKTLDLNKGQDLGRIYKVTQSSMKTVDFDANFFEAEESQIYALAHSNQWVRLTAHRLLNERKLTYADLSNLKSSVINGENMECLHALWILASKERLSMQDLLFAMAHTDSGIRENALIIAEKYISESSIQEKVLALMTDQNQRVRLQASLTSSLFESDNKALSIYESSELACDKWNISALTIAAQTNPIEVFNELIDNGTENFELINSLLYSYSNSPVAISRYLNKLKSLDVTDEEMATFLLSINPQGARVFTNQNLENIISDVEKSNSIQILSASSKLRKALGLSPTKFLSAYVKQAIIHVQEKSQALEARLDQLSIIELIPFADKSELLFSLLSITEPLKIQEAAMNQLWEYKEPSIANFIISNWKALGPQTRRMASDLLLYKENNHNALLTALENKDINIGEMNFDLERRRTLLWWTENENTKSRAEALFSDEGVVNR